MNYYLTYNESPSGVYISQVLDVIDLYINEGIEVKLFAFLSIRDFFKNRAIIKKYLPNSIIIPSFPKLKYWLLNKWILNLFIRNNKNIVISRGVFATNICLKTNNKFSKIIYDGRGAIYAEQKEYAVYRRTGIENQIRDLEQKAVLDSDYRIAVSQKLVNYWINEFKYIKGNEIVIPCSVKYEESINFGNRNYRVLLGLKKEDILLIYSGSLAGWQSFEVLSKILRNFLDKNLNVKILFLSKLEKEIKKLQVKYPNRVYQKWVNPNDVKNYLILGDYGLLIRENNITNQVASPVKFAEYLMAGLNIMITPNIGDYSEFVYINNCGLIINDQIDYRLTKVSNEQRKKNQLLAKNNFSKSSENIINSYKFILKVKS